jgi:[ribosomal protein S5]-alanine N-acetyltransferase
MRRRPRAGTRPAGLISPHGATGETGYEMETDRLILRPITAEAAEALIADRPIAARRLGASIPDGWPHPNLLEFLPQLAADHDVVLPFGAWAIVERSTSQIVGDIGFHGRPDTDGRVEVGYAVVPDRRRRGYASEALAALTAWARSRGDVRDVVARCEPTNEASIRTLASGGFERVGERDGLIEWRLLRGDSGRA